MKPRLSNVLAWWLRRMLPPDRVESVLVDLFEDHAARRRARGSLRAGLWLVQESISLAMAYRRFSREREQTGAGHTLIVSTTIRELRYACRALTGAPAYAAAMIGVLTLGMVLATTVFAVVDGVLFKPLPFPRSHELFSIRAGFKAVDGPTGLRQWLSVSDAVAWREAMPDAGITIFRTTTSSRFEETNGSALGVAEVGPEFFDVVGLRPLIGGFAPDDFTATSDTGTALISYQLWQSRFGGAADIVGRRLVRGTASMRIAGVLPPEFVFPGQRNAQMVMPLRISADERSNPRMRAFEGLLRLPPATRPEVARERIEAAMAVLASSFPALPALPRGRQWANPRLMGPFDRAELTPLDDSLTSRSRASFEAVFAAAAALVLLACVNVSGLMAARSLDRQREINLRRALGARSAHIAALVLAEAAVLVIAGVSLGVLLAVPAVRLATGLLSTDLTLLKDPAIDWRVAGFAMIVFVCAVLGISAWPVRRGLTAASTTKLISSRTVVRVRSTGRFIVVSAQIAIGLTLTIGGTLVVGSLVRLHQEDIGIDPRDVFAIEVAIPTNVTQARPGGAEGVLTRLMAATRSVPGVIVAGATDAPLLRNTLWSDTGWKLPSAARVPGYLNVHGITAGFFDVVRPRLLAGRLPSTEELDSGERVIVVSEAIAAALWPNRPAVGQSLEYAFDDGTSVAFVVVGVVADARFSGWDEPRFRQIYASVLALRRGSTMPSILMRATAPGQVLPALQHLMREEGADVRAIRAMPLEVMLADTVRPRRFQSWLFGSFAGASLAIVGVGVLGLMAMSAARRTREIGLRMALGATRRGVIRLFIREQTAAVLCGGVVGLVGSAWAVRFLQSYLYELTIYDPRVWSVAILLVIGTALAGTFVPAIRATRVDPATALRVE